MRGKPIVGLILAGLLLSALMEGCQPRPVSQWIVAQRPVLTPATREEAVVTMVTRTPITKTDAFPTSAIPGYAAPERSYPTSNPLPPENARGLLPGNLRGQPPMLALGAAHTCLLTQQGSVSCWGANNYGQQGEEREIGVPRFATAITAGAYHTCALSHERVTCWGNNDHGQLGNGTKASSAAPVEVAGLQAVGIDAGYDHTCALHKDGHILCWGSNNAGQSGTSDLTDQPVPVKVQGLPSAATAVSAGRDFTCALLEDGQVDCWGQGIMDQPVEDSTDRSRPAPIAGLSGRATAIATGDSHACALLESGAVMCWMINEAEANQAVPVTIPGLEQGVIAITAGRAHTCALQETGKVVCWGDNSFGQLGTSSGVGASLPTNGLPVEVPGLSGRVLSLDAGAEHTCALLTIGEVHCWGDNAFGQLGNESADWR